MSRTGTPGTRKLHARARRAGGRNVGHHLRAGRCRAGRGSSLCFSGPPGIGKTSLLDAAEAAATGFDCLRATRVPGEFAIGHAGLADIVTPLRPWLSEIPPPQRAALDSALGWSAGGSQNERLLVGAATVSLLSMASQHRPMLVLVDDLQ